ncbi:uncharacterized protein L969DRAFT_14583 [Mixia osmundae IAM 14324]|uniref:Protein kinase domain-containing protein n=1 Tax=Mixia osmundae (strain CBS 9802 / IAM 14324 / JCM 22182 / KY 12970) TaxID=764103 RepID=G7E869_MIXOS|nr:uncharacterized protein L969DRAFT_14583 [Mixia osmundae IAM 14324]KEI42379.1 hypothetical protein L969DRAFT_14583 [Mixia osmundae IAM 14324]GAA99029.1 hypothetical protein E5Q_05718 [Mixia osmundae IAM 14324]
MRRILSYAEDHTPGQPSTFQKRHHYAFTDVGLGQGGFGVVMKATQIKDDTPVAIKKVPKSVVKDKVAYRRIVSFMIDSSHPNIVRFLEAFESKHHFYTVYELVESKQDLFDRLLDVKHFTENDAKAAMRSALSATAYLHDRQVIHRDLKLENFMMRSTHSGPGDLVLIDFGTSLVLQDGQAGGLTEVTGTPGYMAPEIYKKKGYSYLADIWSLGTVCWMLLSGRSLYSTSTDYPVIMRETLALDEAPFPEQVFHDITDDAKAFIRHLLDPSPSTRASARDALDHKWLSRQAMTPKFDTSHRTPASMESDAHGLLPEKGQPKLEDGATVNDAEGSRFAGTATMPHELLDPHSAPDSGTNTPKPTDMAKAREKHTGEELMISSALLERVRTRQ